MTESEGGVGTTRISRRKAIKLGALGAAGGAAAWLLPGTAAAAESLGDPPGICARGSGDVCGRQIRQCGTSKGGRLPHGALCVCAPDSRTPAMHCVEDRLGPEIVLKCTTKADCLPGQLCVKRCRDVGVEVVVSLCAWPCNQGPSGENED